MSLGPSSLGNLLAQRLDTVLGLSQSGTARTGAHPDALRQAQATNRLIATEERHQRGQAGLRPGTDKTDQAGERGRSGSVNRHDARVANQLQRFITDSRFTASAPTTLGRTARTILSLFSQHGSQPVQGRAPLLQSTQLAQALAQSKPQSGANAANTAAIAAHSAKTPEAALDRRNLPPISQSGTSTPASPSTSATQNTPAAHPLNALARAVGGHTALVQLFSQAISQNIQQSGMFYESQLAQLVKGQISPEQLRQQPQAQAHLQAAEPSNENTPTKASTSTQQTTAQQSLHAAQTASNLLQSGIDPSTQHIVRQQLEVLANQLFSWRGEAWPGVPMELEVQRRHDDDETHDGEDPTNEGNTPWQTRLRVELPHLGEVEARLHIDENNLRLHLRAPDSAIQLQEQLTRLTQRLEAQNIRIEQIQIAQNHDDELL